MNQPSPTYRPTTAIAMPCDVEIFHTFTGKERDEETGYGYFGARYMDHELMTMWLSVDPMADKYPNISPYAYCAWNPLKLVDPDGRDWYRNEETGSVTWQKGNSKTIEISGSKYSNIGETYLMRYDWGAVFYNQNEVQEVYEYQNLNDLATSEKGMNALAAKEGCILHPYNDSKGYATIGVGHLIAKRKVDEPIKKEWAWLDTRQEALALFRQDLDDFENGLRKLINPNVKLMQFQYDAIVSFAFNIGLGEKGGKEGFASSEFLRQLNNGVYNGSLMLGWSKPKEIIPRRKKEVNLFDNAIY